MSEPYEPLAVAWERCQGELWTRKRIAPMEIKDGEPVDIPALFESLDKSERHARENPTRIGAKR